MLLLHPIAFSYNIRHFQVKLPDEKTEVKYVGRNVNNSDPDSRLVVKSLSFDTECKSTATYLTRFDT